MVDVNTSSAAQSSGTSDESGGSSMVIVGAILAVIGVIVLAAGLYLVRKYVTGRRASTIVKAVPVQASQQVAATSSTLDPSPGTELADAETGDETKI
jgi:hypothetical protein